MSSVTNLKGAERELLVSLDLMCRGFEVFRPMHATSCDILALKNGITLRIEVKGRKHYHSGPIGSTDGSGSSWDCRLFDIAASVLPSNEILYQRSTFHTINAASQELPLREQYSSRTTKKNRKDKCPT